MPTRSGRYAKMYLNTGAYVTPSWQELTLVRDVTITSTVETADSSSRGVIFNTQVPTGVTIEIQAEFVWDHDDGNLDALHDAHITQTPVDVVALDGPISESGARGWRIPVALITSFDRNEPMTDVITASVTFVPTPGVQPPEYYEVA